MFPISHILVLSQESFVERQVTAVLAGRGWGFLRRRGKPSVSA
jgi:hypothetical protein